MYKFETFKKTIAWTLIASMINPAWIAPAFARDSDIYLASTTGTSTSEPNVLFILGTNDRMNVAEAWREYDPNVYDSHAEYLWNDVSIISPVEVVAEDPNRISDAAPPVNPQYPWGTWSGGLNTDRKALWQATLAYAQGTQPGDPGPRSQYRNYWLASWHYWLPTGTPTTDPRLWSVSFNRFLGFVQNIAGTRGGVTYPSASTANYTTANDYRQYNLCTTSLTQIEPSTIFQPTGRPQNAGYLLNQQWVRYEPWLNLTAVNNPAANYPGNHTTLNGYRIGFLNSSTAPHNTAGAGPGNGPDNVYRDSMGGNIGTTGQPIRIQKDKPDSTGAGTANVVDAGDSYGGWTDPAADMGGFVFQSWTGTATAGYYYPSSVLTALRGVYGYSLPSFTGSAGVVEQFAAWLGNRDGAPAFGNKVGTPAYYDLSSGLRGAAQTQCDPTAGPGVANQCTNLVSGSYTATWTQTCSPGGAIKAEKDAQDTIRYSQNTVTCVNNAGGPVIFAGRPGLTCTSTDPTNPLCQTPLLTPPVGSPNCGTTNFQTTFYTRWNNTAAPLPCVWSPAQTNQPVAACAWTGRTSVYIEGQGTYFYGGTCGESGTVVPTNTSCSIGGGTWVASRTLNGVSQTDVTGPFSSPPPANGATTLACNQVIAVGNYNWGGSCVPNATTGQWTAPAAIGTTTTGTPAALQTVAPVAPASQRTAVNPAACSITGGSALTIRGLAKTYNQACGPTNATVDQTCSTRYGASCFSDGTLSNHCPGSVNTGALALGGGANNYYQSYFQQATQSALYHECLADSPAQNPGGNSYPTAQVRTFGGNANATLATMQTTNANTTYAGGTAAQRLAPYDTTSGRGVAADPTKNIDVYSTNYMNFLYGAKACRDSAGNLITTSPVSAPPAGATCSPIARKTRLAVAKDALSNLVTSTNSVRLGLMNYNRTASCQSTAGRIPANSNSFTSISPNPGFVATNPVTIVGAGPGGAALNTTISSISGSAPAVTYTLAATTANPTTTGSMGAPTTATTTAGSNIITVAAPAGYAVGQQVTIVGMGAGGTDLTANITAIAGSTFTLSSNASVSTTVGPPAVPPAAMSSNSVTVVSAASFAVGEELSVAGADPGNVATGGALISGINSITGNTITLGAPATAAVSGAAVAISAYVTSLQVNPCSSNVIDDGGNISYAIRRMGNNASDPDYGNRAALVAAIQAVSASSRTPLTETLYESYLYFSGRAPKWGTASGTASIGGSVTAGRETTTGTNTDGPPQKVYLLNAAGTKYNSPMLNNPRTTGVGNPANCQKNYIVMITNGQAEDDAAANADIKTMAYAAASGATVSPRTDFDTSGATPNNAGAPDYHQIPTVIGGNPYGPQDTAGTGADGGYVWLDELAYFMSAADVSPGAANFQSEYSNCANPSGTHVCSTPTTVDAISGRQSIVTYTIGFAGVNAPVVQNAAVVSGGVYYVAQNAQQLQAALTAAFIAIVSYDATTAAVTVPISSLNRGVSSSDIYLAFFAPSAASVWPGTVKKYQLSVLDTDCGIGFAPCLIGQTQVNGTYNIESTDPVTGQSVVDPAVSSGPNDTHHPPGSAWYASTIQDGSKPNKGGTGHVLINTAGYTPDQRKIYTFLTDSVPLQNSLSTTTQLAGAFIGDHSNEVDFNTNAGGATRCRLGDVAACGGSPTMSFATKETLISYIRGGNLGDSNCTDGSTSGSGTACTTWSTWPHTGVEHSKPAVVTYNSADPINGQYMYYLQTNGMLTAVNTHTGQEKWSFLVEEALPKIQAMVANVNGPEIYAADGDPVLFYDDVNGDGNIVSSDGDRVWLYFGLRRGGKSYYALDVTNKDAPVFKWKISNETGAGKICRNSSHCTSAGASVFSELGQTWSTPSVGKIRFLYGASNNPPAVIFGGGYDPGEDSVPPSSRTMGRAVYVINGDDATVIQSWGAGAAGGGSYRGAGAITTYAIPSQITAINADFDGGNYLDRLVVGDLGGNVWRFDIDDPVPANWRGEQLASLSANPLAEPKRKFFFPPAVAPQNATGFDFHAVYIGSGDKEHPLLTSATVPATTDDLMFMLMDDPSLNSGGGTPSSGGPSALPTPITIGTLISIPNSQVSGVPASALVGQQGWYRALDLGEKVINAPSVFKFQLTVSRLTFGTYAPTAQLNACTPPGEGRLNEIDSLTGDLIQLNGTSLPPSRYFTDFKGRGYVSSSQSLVLETSGGRTATQVVCIGPSCKFQNTGTLGAPTKIYWYMEPEQ